MHLKPKVRKEKGYKKYGNNKKPLCYAPPEYGFSAKKQLALFGNGSLAISTNLIFNILIFMKPLKFLIGIAIVCLSCAFSCEKEWDKLPEATKTGENTIGCYVDGVAWAMGTELTKIPSIGASPTISGDTLTLRLVAIGQNRMNDAAPAETSSTLYFSLINPKLGDNVIEVASARFEMTSPEPFGLYVGRKVGNVHITRLEFDPATQQGVISGLFTCSLRYEKDLTKVIKLTDGRFDLRIRPFQHFIPDEM